ncbi:O-antigen ligase family protein [Tsukamurella sputi]|uniref:O-antigen ligase family protein n=1 Tax=Tsukamurella sputi TaxID=2591848 RepID=A0A5C5RS16_9ACTN|nr:O-antigen ligase family protein [Tsukamurella sputi]TWS25809.1 O-antigen ligase family protein [Tsukamurella sputi]
MVLLLAAAAALLLVGALLPWSTLWLPPGAQRRAAVMTVLLTAWPVSWTFLFGPLLFGGAAPSYYPVIWYGPAMAAGVTILVQNLNSPHARPVRASVLMAAVSVLTLLSVVLAPKNSSDIIRWGMAAVLLSAALISAERVPAQAIMVGCRIALVWTAVSVLVAVVVNPAVISECRADKCGIAGRVLTSPFAGNGNILGLYAAMLLPFALHRAGVVRAVLTVVGVLSICELAGSRSALIGVAVATAGYVALAASASQRTRSAIVGVGLLGCLAGSLVPALMVYGNEAFTFRGTLWNRAKEFIVDHPVFGSGPTAWEKFGLTSVDDANYSPHNIWLDTTVSVGLWGVAVMAAAMVLHLWRSDADDRAAIGLYLCTLLGIGALESLFVPYFLGIAPFVAVLPLLVGGGPVPAHGPAPPIGEPSDRDIERLIPAATTVAATTPGDPWT